MATPTARTAKDLAAASLLRAWLADDKPAGVLIINQNGAQHLGREADELVNLLLAVTGLAGRCLLSANGYDSDRALAVIDIWMTRLAAATDQSTHADG